MGDVGKRVEKDGREFHVGTGKAVTGWEHGRTFEEHVPQWGQWEADGPVSVRFCQHGDCDLMDVQ